MAIFLGLILILVVIDWFLINLGPAHVLEKTRTTKKAIVLTKDILSDHAPLPPLDDFDRGRHRPLHLVIPSYDTYSLTLRLVSGELQRIDSEVPFSYVQKGEEVRVLEEITVYEHRGLFRKKKETIKRIRAINDHIV